MARPKGQPKLGGRQKGTRNKLTVAVKDMILQALNEAHKDGGTAYLKEQAARNPVAFMTLVGKLVPLDINAAVEGEIGMKPILLGAPPPE